MPRAIAAALALALMMALLASLSGLWPSAPLARAQDHPLVNAHEWISKARNAYDESCCGKNDTRALTPDEANALAIGSKIIVRDARGSQEITINVIHPSLDPQERPWVTSYGCLFRSPGV